MDFNTTLSILTESKCGDNKSKRAADIKAGLYVDPMKDDPKQYGVFGESGTCYLSYVSKAEAKEYIRKQK